MLRNAIKLARELSIKHRRCPFVLSYHQRGTYNQLGNKKHMSQVTPDRLSKDFATVRDSCELTWPKKNPASFHETKGLFIKLASQQYSEKQVQEASAHLNSSTTKTYIENHQPIYKNIDVVITEEMLGSKL